MAYHIYHNVPIKGNKRAIFDAVSLPAELIKWWPQRCTGHRGLGEEYNLFFTEEYDWYGKVVLLEEDHSFHIKMTKSTIEWNPTTFGFDLEEEANGTVLLQFSNRNWQSESNEMKKSSYYWALLLHGLKNYIEKGIVIPFENRN